MFTNRLQSEKFDKEILNNLEKFKSFEIATGYIGSEIINKFENDLIKIARKGYCKILIGMIFHGGVSKNQKNTLERIDKKLRKINSKSGVYIIREDYHGKIYRFNDDNQKIIYIGSSNFSYQGLSKRLECNIPIRDKNTENDVSKFLDFLFNHKETVNLERVDLRLKKSKFKKDKKTLKDYIVNESLFPNIKPKSVNKIKLRPDEQPRSSLNLFFDKGRLTLKKNQKVWVPRDWYEVEITTQKKEQTKDYPRGKFTGWLKDENIYYKIDMITSGGNVPQRNIKGYKDMMSRDRSLFGEFIKGKLQRGGHLNENERITSDTLISYGKDEIVLKKIDEANYFIEF